MILDEPEIDLVAMEPIVPDIAGWRAERMPTLPETAYFSPAPDRVCEVLAKSPEAIDRNEKLPLYAQRGVRHVWLVDPIAKTLEVHVLGDNARWSEVRIHQGNAKLRVPPFEAIELELGALWDGPVVVR